MVEPNQDEGVLDEIYRILKAVAATPNELICYSDLGNRLTDRLGARDPNLHGSLDTINRREDARGHGLLSAVVVNKYKRMPGEGFFYLARELGRDITDQRKCWQDELNRVRIENSV